MSMLWRQTTIIDARARALADRHYYRKVIGAYQFLPPGYRVVLILPNGRAVWASHTPAEGVTRADGLECWDCPIFRNESGRLASVLIRQALGATRWAWLHRPLPRDGFITFIDERKVAVPPHGQPYGWTFMAAGFVPIGRTRVNDLLILQLTRERLAAIEPRPVPQIGGGVQMSLLEVG